MLIPIMLIFTGVDTFSMSLYSGWVIIYSLECVYTELKANGIKTLFYC